MSSVLDEKLVMDSDVVGEVLHRRIPPQELSESRDSLDFGVMPASLMETEIVTNPSPESRSRDIVSKKRKLWSEKNDGMVQWGVRRQVNEDMAGKLAPVGNERFRWNNEEGTMEYCLESADLANIRKEAGVQDSYWVPLAGWKPGENPNICSSEIKLLKEEMTKMKRDMMELVSKKQGEGDLAIVTTPISCNTNHHMVEDISNKQGDGDLAIVTTPISCDTNPNMKRDEKELFHESVKRKAKLEEQLVQVSHSLQKIEEEMGQLESAIQMQRSYYEKKGGIDRGRGEKQGDIRSGRRG